MNIQYFSEQELGPRPRTEEAIGKEPWGAVVALIRSRIADGSFGFRYGDECHDGRGIVGTDEGSLSLALRGVVPGIAWPLNPTNVPSTLAILDLIQFCYQSVAELLKGGWHSFFEHHHLHFNQKQGQERFRADVNRIFLRNGITYDLTEDGNVIRLGPVVLREELSNAVFRTGDTELDRMLETARTKFLSANLGVRKEAIEKLWDAWERVKTLEVPGEKNKRASTSQLLDKAAIQPKFRELLEQEALALTAIGNDFQIRHSETYKTPIEESEHVDYLFHRLFALIRLVLRRSSRGG